MSASEGTRRLRVEGSGCCACAQPARAGRREPSSASWRRDPRTLSTLASTVLLALAVLAALLGAPRVVAEPLYLIAMAVGGWPIAGAALVALRVRSLDMNVLMALAAVGAVAIGAYAEGAWVLVLFAVGTTLESFALDRTRNAVNALLELAPAEARVIADGRERNVGVEELRPGDRVVVRPGERLAIDGEVVEGASSVDQSAVTGESVPVDVAPGVEVFAGSLNVQGALVVRASRPADESALSRIAALVEQAQNSRAPAERFIDRFARGYTPLVFGAAVALALVPPLVFGADAGTWVYRALALLIVACPCSLVISVPVTVVSAIGGAARDGILIKGGEALETLARVDAVALDKTGTLTAARPELARVVALDSGDAEAALTLMGALEERSEHPLAAAIVRAARERKPAFGRLDAFEALPGRGVEATVDGVGYWAGGPRLAAERLGGPLPAVMDELHAEGQTALLLGRGERPIAAFGLADRARPEATTAVAALKQSGVERILMLSGDSEPVARAVAAETGIGEWRAGLLPQDKLTAIDELQRSGRTVAMVGDGINDAPALAAASVGVAMGAAGSDVALRSADVALLSDRLDRLAPAFQRARSALTVMRVNVVASLAVKALFVVLAPFGLVTLVLAVAADMGMSLLVTVNALRLLAPEGAILPRGL